MNDNIRNYFAEKTLADAIQEAINLRFGFVACGLSFDELIKELNNG